MLALVGALGAVDDYLNARTGIGIRGRHKILWQLVVAIVVAIYVQNHFGFNGFRVPFIGDVVYTQTIAIPFTDRGVELGAILFIVVAVVAIVGCSNGVNLTDGLDGLAGGTLVFAFISFLIIALLNQPLQPNLAMVNAIVIGAILGFLWFNVHPAQVFMGDSGALSLGGDAGRDRPHHRPGPDPAPDRHHLRPRGRLGHHPGGELQAPRQARVPDGPAPPPLRAGRLGRGEDHDALLDRRALWPACSG